MSTRRNSIKRLAFLGVCTSVALVLAWLESFIPPIYSALPGIKLGLPNIAILFILYRYGLLDAAAVSFVRVCIVSMLFGNAEILAYSLAGAALSLVGMALLKHCKLFSTVGVSVAGGVLHNVGQILMAMLLLRTVEIGYYLIVLVLTGIASGILVGLCGGWIVKRFDLKKY